MRLPIQINALISRVTNGTPEFLLLKRIPEKGGFWQTVSGGFEEGDLSLLDTCYRELKEELDIDKDSFVRIYEKIAINQFESDPIKNKEQSNYKNLIGDTLHMTVFVFGFLVSSEFTKNFQDYENFAEEHTEFRWVSALEAERLLIHANSINAIKKFEELLTTT